MYVFRPQHIGCSTNCGRPAQHSSRQGLKVPRRQCRHHRAQLPVRRRRQLRDLVNHPSRRPPAAQEFTNSWASDAAVGADLQDSVGDKRGPNTRMRLRSQLIERRTAELVAALERRHGEDWAAQVLRGDFHANEGMRRICEAFCLRPDLEHRVLLATVERARGFPQNSCRNCGIQFGPEVDSKAQLPFKVAGWPLPPPALAQESDGDQSLASYSQSSPAFSAETSPTMSPAFSLAPCPVSDGGSSPRMQNSCSDVSEYEEEERLLDSSEADVEADVENDNTQISSFVRELASPGQQKPANDVSPPLQVGATKHPIGLTTCSTSAPTSRLVRWSKRALQALGLNMRWPSGDNQDKFGSNTKGQLGQQVGDNANEAQNTIIEEEEEEHLLSSKLMAAVRNAERQAASARALRKLQCNNSPDGISVMLAHAISTTAGTNAVSTSTSIPTAARSVSISVGSDICFFGPEPEADTESSWQYQRTLETKSFDGPSGHKAKRFNSKLSKELFGFINNQSGDFKSNDSEDDVDDDEEWESKCDDIADLMSQQRHLLLWSASW